MIELFIAFALGAGLGIWARDRDMLDRARKLEAQGAEIKKQITDLIEAHERFKDEQGRRNL